MNTKTVVRAGDLSAVPSGAVANRAAPGAAASPQRRVVTYSSAAIETTRAIWEAVPNDENVCGGRGGLLAWPGLSGNLADRTPAGAWQRDVPTLCTNWEQRSRTVGANGQWAPIRNGAGITLARARAQRLSVVSNAGLAASHVANAFASSVVDRRAGQEWR